MTPSAPWAKTWLKRSLGGAAGHFFLLALVHQIDFRWPGLYIYFDVPSNGYQDQLISLLAFGWAVLFFSASKASESLKEWSLAVLIAGLGGVLGLCWINATNDFSQLTQAADPIVYWLETAGLAVYLGWLGFLHQYAFLPRPESGLSLQVTLAPTSPEGHV
ncbi:MAG: hypothetical protein RRB13_13780 [bacterium]|nr:hypothetical protein [bacterium]